MPDRDFAATNPLTDIPDDEIARILANQLPQWKRACDNPGGDIMIIEQEVFRRSITDATLLYAAIRYAGAAGKTVMIAPYDS